MSPHEIKQLRLKEGDILLVTAPDGTDADRLLELVRELEKVLEGLPLPNIRIVGVASGIRVEVEPAA